jgi:hypothetical protein
MLGYAFIITDGEGQGASSTHLGRVYCKDKRLYLMLACALFANDGQSGGNTGHPGMLWAHTWAAYTVCDAGMCGMQPNAAAADTQPCSIVLHGPLQLRTMYCGLWQPQPSEAWFRLNRSHHTARLPCDISMPFDLTLSGLVTGKVQCLH